MLTALAWLMLGLVSGGLGIYARAEPAGDRGARMITHPCSQEHPWILEETPAVLLRAWSVDCLLPAPAADLFAAVDALACITAERLTPTAHVVDPVICQGCRTPIDMLSWACLCPS